MRFNRETFCFKIITYILLKKGNVLLVTYQINEKYRIFHVYTVWWNRNNETIFFLLKFNFHQLIKVPKWSINASTKVWFKNIKIFSSRNEILKVCVSKNALIAQPPNRLNLNSAWDTILVMLATIWRVQVMSKCTS